MEIKKMHPKIKKIQEIRKEVGKVNTELFNVQELKVEFFVIWAETKAMLNDEDEPPSIEESNNLGFELTELNIFIANCDEKIGKLEAQRDYLLSRLENFE